MIGLVDLAFQNSPSLCPPNIEIMKLAEYYKYEENKFCRLIPLDETELDGYSKIFIFSENDSYITVPDAFKRSQNIVYGGSSFTNKIYVPFKNELIDFTLAKPRIYTNILNEKYIAGEKEKNINHILDDSYYRRFAGDQELPIPPVNKRKRFYIYDRNFFQEGWENIIDKIVERNPSSINFIHSLHFNKITDFLTVRQIDIIAKGQDTYLDLQVPLNEINVLMKRYKNKLLELITQSSAIYLPIGGSFYYQLEYYKNYIYKLNLLYRFWAHGIPIKLKYEEPTLGCYDPLKDLSIHTAIWSRSPLNKDQSILDRIPKDKSLNEIRPQRVQARIFMEKFPQQAILLKQTLDIITQGGWNK